MQSVVSGVVTAACPEQSNAISVRDMALKCYCLNVRSQAAITECVELTHIGVRWRARIRGSSSVSLATSTCESDQQDPEEEDEVRVMEEEIRSQDFIGMLNFRDRDEDSFSLVNQYSSRSVSSEESERTGCQSARSESARSESTRSH
eukprot:958646-Amphidinium_carterae.1